ncbi:DUF1298 domain-containing protein, partial [Mycobacterium sp.]|uniref:DUF1298 domain-containing protein n=1 Tax=Mycobacterium sp. TaxID=1785 RepID=UPI0025E5C6D9
MPGRRMAAVDAQSYWTSAKIPNDEFLLYAFDGEPEDLDRAVDQICRRARVCPGLTIRVEDGWALTYPRWVPAPVGPERVICHDLADRSWHGCLAALSDLFADQLDIRRTPWRVHLFTSVTGIPRCTGTGTVAAVQVPHALADGARGSAMAAWLFGREAPVPELERLRAGFLPCRAFDATRTHRRMLRDIEAGLLVAPLAPRPPLSTNARPEGTRSIRTLVRQRSQLRGPTVTVSVLTAVSAALSKLLGPEAESLGAEVPIAKLGVPHAYNHFGNVVVGLHPTLGLGDRAERIAADLANGRRRFEHPATRSADRAFAAMPAALLRWGISQFDPNVQPVQVAGNTVVSSVNRGAAD